MKTVRKRLPRPPLFLLPKQFWLPGAKKPPSESSGRTGALNDMKSSSWRWEQPHIRGCPSGRAGKLTWSLLGTCTINTRLKFCDMWDIQHTCILSDINFGAKRKICSCCLPASLAEH